MTMRAAALIPILLAVACTPASPPASDDVDPSAATGAVSLDVTPSSVARGDSTTLTLHNASADTVGYNLCASGLEHLTGDGAEPVPSDRVCTMELRLLDPGDEAHYSLTIPMSLEAGDYRYRTRVEMMGGGARNDVTSSTFHVTG